MRIHRAMMSLARTMAILGGLVLTLLVILTCVSVLGRGINTFLHWGVVQNAVPGLAQTLLDTGIGPVLGDFELVEAGVAFSIFSFLPFCQITAGHATVDIFTARLPVWVNRFIQLVVEVVFAIVLIVIAWRLYEGMLGKMKYNETTFMLQFPMWWAYGASLIAAVVAAIVGVYMAYVRIIEFISGHVIVESAGVDH